MANRSDFNSTCPRRLKRQLALQSTLDPHRDGEIKRLMISAHKHNVDVVNRRLRSGRVEEESEETND